MNYRIEEPFSSIQPSDIQKLELEIGFPLPRDYTNFLLKYNGGTIQPNQFRYSFIPGCTQIHSDDGQLGKYHIIDFLFGFLQPDDKYFTSCSISFVRNCMLAGEETPDDVLPIGTTGNGDTIFIKLAGKTSENIYIWLHEKLVDADDSEDLPLCYNAHYIASSFTEFLESLF